MTELHDHITMSFLLVGRTKFAPDWCFGLLKLAWKSTIWNTSEITLEVLERVYSETRGPKTSIKMTVLAGVDKNQGELA